ncbi:hypothetical protein P170DRAFT_433537 [Aspergillus steynii IBT 23096]|uniref:Uncharacterized protein n=1 Tax=Aspergillus steynii IBT 23096 TaxID=1392250 RepID=A0A2I2GFK1_9EURO|nr:uncharacterized protein P170DRAFT_433537 [Aspergillus steynii IBT 23096]PLB51660.1 hypothetical protein P170DRAFT_433537 [Aspergillus steynii IBT 23096]
MDQSLHPNVILRLSYPSLSEHFIDLIGIQPSIEHVNTTNARLLDLIHAEALPPTVYKIWLPIALKHCPHILSTTLRDPVSHYIRAIGIQQLARISRSASWKTRGWNVLGNVEGIRDIVQDLSIIEIRSLLDAIAQSIRRPDEDLPAHIEQLVHLLHDDKSSRSIGHYLDTLLPLCTSPFVENALSSLPEGRLNHRLFDRISLRHPALLRRIATGQVTVSHSAQKDATKYCMRAMIWSLTPYTPVYYKPDSAPSLPGIRFILDLLHTMAEKDPKKLELSSIKPYIHDALRHICRQKAYFQEIYILFEKTLPLVAIHSDEELTELLVTELIRCWSIAGFGTATETNSPLETLPHPKHPSRPSTDDKDRLEGLLIDVLQRCSIEISQSDGESSFETIQDILEDIAAEARFPFLKLVCRHSKDIEIDLDLPPTGKEKKLLAIWPYSIMELLPAADIRRLFDRMFLIHGCTEYVPVLDGPDSILSWPAQCQLKARCEADVATTDHHFPTTKAGISEMRKRAEKEKDPKNRLYWGKQALETALVSRSLELISEVIQWSARFVRDSAVFPGLVETYVSSDELPLLLGCDESRFLGRPRTLHALQEQREHADSILMNVLRVLTKASKEPSYRAGTSRDLMPFIGKIVESRMRALRQSQSKGIASQADLVALLLNPLIDVILRYDHIGIELSWWKEHGVVMSALGVDQFNSQVFLSFMDHLTRRHDEYWKAKRTQERDNHNKHVGFPEGLTVRHLIPSYLIPLVLEKPDATPYTATRVHAVLFGSVDVLMTPVSKSQLEDDTAVDELGKVIFSYISRCSRKLQAERVLRVWKYYATILEPYPDHLSMFRQWLARKAKEWNLRKVAWIINPTSIPDWHYPDSTSGADAVKWDPCGHAGKDEIATPLTVLHCRMKGEVPLTDVVTEQMKRIRGPAQIWMSDEQLLQNMSLKECDTLVLSALLFLGTLTNKPLLSEAFPTSEAARWPPIVLDSRFVSLTKKGTHNSIIQATQAIKKGIKFVPAQALRHLITSLLDSLPQAPASKYSMLFQCIVKLIKLFPSMDQPQLGMDFVLHIIKDFPDDSAYHRHLRVSDLGKALDPQHAVLLMQSLADFVCERLRSPSEFVKVTTVKMVVQLVAAAEFIPTRNSLSILQSIYEASSHTDVRAEVVSAILFLLERDSVQADNLYSFLRELTLSAVGPNRTDQISKWTIAEQEGRLPDVSDFCSQHTIELFTLAAFHKIHESDRGRYAQDILLPMVDESIKHHNRWMKSFLRHFDLAPEDFDIDFGPFVPDTVNFVLNIWHDYLPASFLVHDCFFAVTYTANASFEIINSHLTTSPKASSLESTAALQHWNEVLDSHRRVNPFHSLQVLLSRDLQSTLPQNTGITDEIICPEYRHRAGIVARSPMKHYNLSHERIAAHSVLVNGLTALRGPRDAPGNSVDRHNLFKTLMQDIVDDIETLRRENKGNAISAKLPSPIQLQAKLLPAPDFNPLVEDPLSSFADALVELIGKCTDPMTVLDSHHIEVMMGTVDTDLTIPLVLKLGSGLDINTTDTATCLTVKIAAKLLSKVKRADILANEDLVILLTTWKESSNEYISRMAWVVTG